MASNGNPLDRTPDMEGLSSADRARIYKERAAAAGIGRAPNPETASSEPAPKPASPPARPAAADGAAKPAVSAPVAAKAAAANAAGAKGGASALTPEQRERLAQVAQRGGGARPAEAAAPSAVAAQQQRLVYVWPHLVTIEFMSAVIMLLSMFLLSFVIQAPLEAHANPDKTPNPSKAPWYFLNLQELLLHMHPALAGVIVPTAALALIAAIPYFDRNTRDVGKWFGTPKAVPITWFTTWYTTAVLTVLIFFDEWVGVKPLMTNITKATGIEFLSSGFVTDILVPLLLMIAPIVLLIALVRRIYKPDGVRDWMICFFTGFFVVYIVLTVFGTFFRGQGMHLYWPWDPRMARIE